MFEPARTQERERRPKTGGAAGRREGGGAPLRERNSQTAILKVLATCSLIGSAVSSRDLLCERADFLGLLGDRVDLFARELAFNAT